MAEAELASIRRRRYAKRADEPLTEAEMRRRQHVARHGSLGQKLSMLSDSRNLRFRKLHRGPEPGVIIGFLFFMACMVIFYVYVLPKPKGGKHHIQHTPGGQ